MSINTPPNENKGDWGSSQKESGQVPSVKTAEEHALPKVQDARTVSGGVMERVDNTMGRNNQNNVPVIFHLEAHDGKDILYVTNVPGTSESDVRTFFSSLIEGHRIDEIQFDRTLLVSEKRMLANILTKNYPLIEVIRLMPGSELINIIFSWVKKLNELYGPSFMDNVLAATKTRIMKGADEYSQASNTYQGMEHVRLVRDDYKNLTLSVPSGTPAVPVLFRGISTKKEFMDAVIFDLQETIALLAQENDIAVIGIEEDIRRYFNFWVGKSKVETGIGNMDKLHAFAGAEWVSREGLASDDIMEHVFDRNRYEIYAKNFIALEEEIIAQWSGAKFTIGGISDSVIISIGRQKFLNVELLRQIRKQWVVGAGIEPISLAQDVEQYINLLNMGFDFIVPALNLEEDIQAAEKISKDFWNGIIGVDSLIKTFKGMVAREHFMYTVGNAPGMRIFIDIKDMGIENLHSFRYIAKKVASGTYTPDDLLSAGKEMTDRFTLFVKEINTSHPNALISLWWDEIRIFFPGITKSESSNILASISKKLEYSGLEGRSSHTLEVGTEANDNEKIFKKLDESTSLHKMIENMLLRKRILLKKPQNILETISLELGAGINDENLVKLSRNKELEKALGRIIDTVTNGNARPKDISLPGWWMLHFKSEWGLLKFLFTHAI